jgi:hypothetical protein
METIQELYAHNVRNRPTSERLQLAAMILNDIAPQSVADESETWTDEDIQDFRNASQSYVHRRIEEEENA